MIETLDLKIERVLKPRLILEIDEEDGYGEIIEVILPEPYKLERVSSSTLFIYYGEKIYPQTISLRLKDLTPNLHASLLALADPRNVDILPVKPLTQTQVYEFNNRNLKEIAFYEGDFTLPGFRWPENKLGVRKKEELLTEDYQAVSQIWMNLYSELKKRLLTEKKERRRDKIKLFFEILKKGYSFQ